MTTSKSSFFLFYICEHDEQVYDIALKMRNKVQLVYLEQYQTLDHMCHFEKLENLDNGSSSIGASILCKEKNIDTYHF